MSDLRRLQKIVFAGGMITTLNAIALPCTAQSFRADWISSSKRTVIEDPRDFCYEGATVGKTWFGEPYSGWLDLDQGNPCNIGQPFTVLFHMSNDPETKHVTGYALITPNPDNTEAHIDWFLTGGDIEPKHWQIDVHAAW